MSILRTADVVRAAEYDLPQDKLDNEMVQLAETILDRLAGEWNPAGFNDRYQDALRELVEAKVKGLPAAAPRPVSAPSNVIDLMAALKKSVAESPTKASAKREKKSAARDRRQGNILLPVKGSGNAPRALAEKPDARRGARRKKA
jgi:DNA end-binding protein Ku